MFQQFFKDTLISRFIKRLLRSTNIPLLHTLHENSVMTKDCLYLYKNYVIKCVTSGRFHVNPEDALYPGDKIYPSTYLLPSTYINREGIFIGPSGSYVLGHYKIVKYYSEDDPQIHYNFHSKFLYYDPETHLHLGEYLRYIKDRQDLNLMPYYNCFNNKSINRVYIHAPNDNGETFSLSTNINYKLLAIPVKFGQTYTIAIDSDTPIQLRSLIYNDDCGCIKKNRSEEAYYSNDIDDYEFMPFSSFTKPFIKTIPDAPSKEAFAQEKNLYLIIQVSKYNESAITVLEGDYVNSWNSINNIQCACSGKESQESYYKNLSLLQFNSHTSFAFCDRLIEYLLLGVINPTDPIDENIAYMQELITNYNPKYTFNMRGIWTKSLRDTTHLIEKDILEKYLLRDLDGYLNKDLERFLLINKERN